MNRIFNAFLFPTLLSAIVVAFSFNVFAEDSLAAPQKSAICAGCHGATGDSMTSINPKLAGQSEKYIIKQLNDIKSGARISAMMMGFAMSLSEQDIAELAAYYASQATSSTTTDMSTEDKVIGERIYRAGNETSGVPACLGCHGSAGEGNALAGFPRLAGQHSAYTSAQLKAFRLAAQYPKDTTKGRRNDGEARIMRDVSLNMTDRELQAVADYIQGM